MIKIEKVETFGWEHAMRGTRNPLNSWEQSDTPSTWDPNDPTSGPMGVKDLDLAMRLSKAGSDHAKYLRMIVVYMDITAPRYFHHQLDTYKVGTVKNSCSTMHTITKKPFSKEDFSTSHYRINWIIDVLNELRLEYLDEKENGSSKNAKGIWDNLIAMLPQSYNQKFTWMANYEVLKNIYHSRRNHKLQEWRDFCEMIEGLPCSQLITLKEGEPHPQD